MFTAFRKERNRCGGSAVAANGRIMREGETTRIIRPFAHHSRILRDAGLQRAIGLRILLASLTPPHDLLRKAAAFRDHVRNYAPRGTRKSLFRHGLTNMRPQCRVHPEP